MSWRRWLSLGCVALGAALVPARAQAQVVAPTGGHYGARASDTGFMGEVNSSGGYSTSVPLDLPPARGGLPIPIQIVYGEHGFGAAGLGWDVPLSFVRRDTTFTRRRPLNGAGAPQSREQVSVTLNGGRIDLVRTATAWVGRHDATDIEVRQQSDGSWVMYDGRGLTYTFALVSSALANTNIWLLTDITGAAGAKVHLDYTIATPSLPGGAGVSIDLKTVSYNPSPIAGQSCYKHSVNLNYGSNATAPLSTFVLGSAIGVRMHTLSSVDVVARSSCDSGTEIQRKYQLTYASDRDTGQSRLRSVTMTGRAGTPQSAVTLPVATYSYGSVSNGVQLTYHKASSAALGFSALGDTTVVDNEFQTRSMLIDMTGDGRPDLVTMNAGNDLMARKNTSAVDGVLFEANATTLRTQASSPDSVAPDGTGNGRESTWRQVIDFNGDGRLDLLDAFETPGAWVVYLNTPDAVNPDIIRWQRQQFPIAPMMQQLQARGIAITGSWLPLSRRITSSDFVQDPTLCWVWVPVDEAWERIPEDDASCPEAPLLGELHRTTIVEWEVRDINGDGYPDLVFNSSPVIFPRRTTPFPQNPRDWEEVAQTKVTYPALASTNRIEAMLNVVGVRNPSSSTGSWFSDPVTLISNDSCGVARWTTGQAASAPFQSQTCGMEDVNGDGIVDRINDRSVFLGKGTSSSTGWFTAGAMITLPGSMVVEQNARALNCSIDGVTTYSASQFAGLRDLTGDGIPDYVSKDGGGAVAVRIGTGTGFGSPLAVTGAFELSLQTERCDGTSSTTYGGLFDVDGDGKPDVVSSAEVSSAEVWLLVGPSGAPGAPEAGRLTQIDNGYGAQTNIHYRSIKGDPGSHQVPFPEIVVDSISTSGTRGQGGDLSVMSYAYDGAQLLFDPATDAFRFRGYRRRLELPTPISQPAGVAALVITDYYAPVSPADPDGPAVDAADRDTRYMRYLRAGRVSDITVLSGDFGAANLANPSQLLSIDVTKDIRRIGQAHYDWLAQLVTDSSDPAAPECLEMVFPYDYSRSLSYAQNAANHAYAVCTAHGFAYESAVDSWRSEPGAAPSSSTANVETRSEVQAIDTLGRPLRVAYFNDVHQTDDDLCVDTVYAAPTGANERVLFAPASQTVSACGATTTYAKETWEYDGQASGSVAAGLVTSHTVERRDDTGAPLGTGTIRQFDATFDAAGNPKTVTTTREDGATRTVTVGYDPFGLAVATTTVTASGGLTLQTTITRDSVTLNPTSVTDPNRTQYGTAFDGFNRVTQTTVMPPGGSLGVLSTFKYYGFAKAPPVGECIPNQTLRCVVTKVFPDPVAPTDVDSAPGHIGTAFLDELGRSYRSEVQLGADYPGKKIVASSRVYDGHGRVLLEREPFAIATGDADPPIYATTYYFNADGTPSCFVRGTEKQPYTEASDESHQIFPTCFRRSFENHAEVVKVKDASSLLSHSPQDGVEQRSYLTAIGRTLERSTWQGGARLEYARFAYDPLGRRTSMTRYQDAAGGTKPVVSSWHFDSLGQMTELDEPDSVPQYNTYSNWGELLQTYRRVTSAGGTTIARSVVKQYDALSRVVHSEERTDNVADADTLYDYFYDQGIHIAPQVTPTNMLGRLAQASSPTGAVTFSYDALGQVNARVFTDPQGTMHVEKHSWHADGTPSALDLYLPDTAYADEHVDYTYDSAGRSKTVKYSAADNQDLFAAPTFDLLGRLRQAQFGQATYSAAYDDVGRRLLTQVAVSSSGGSRTYNFPDYDPVGRIRSRREVKDGTTRTTTFAYDALGRLSSSVRTMSGTTLFDQRFTYDPLGNLLTRSDAAASSGTASTTLSYLDTDRDRICRIAFGNDTATTCNVTYDELGAITSQQTLTSTRQYTYYLDGNVRTLTDDHGSTAHFRYDALGGVQTLDLTSPISPDQRQDVHHGELLLWRNANTSNAFLVRKIPGPDGSIASRRGAGGPWVFEFGEPRGNRFFVDNNGAFVQDVDYDSFGTPTSTGAQPGDKRYSTEQWNGGDALAAFGISQLGARLYDPAIGRFLSRDPLLFPRTSTTTNPYAFASNDPVNSSDPSGLQEAPPGGTDDGSLDTTPSDGSSIGSLTIDTGRDPVDLAQQQIGFQRLQQTLHYTMIQGSIEPHRGIVGTLRDMAADTLEVCVVAAGAAVGAALGAACGAPTGPGAVATTATGAVLGAGAFNAAASPALDFIRGTKPSVAHVEQAAIDGMEMEMGGQVLTEYVMPIIVSSITKIRASIPFGKGVGGTLAASAPGTSALKLSREAQKAIRTLEKRLAEHEAKLSAYREDPFKFDNRGHLARNAGRPEIQQQIIEARIHHLETEIRNFQEQLERLRSGSVEP